MKKVLSIFLVIVMLCSTFAGLQVTSHALDNSGSCGTNVTYTFNSSTGLLTISGSGAMTNYYSSSSSPFYKQTSIKIVVIENGVTGIGNNAFYDCANIVELSLPTTLITIGDKAFLRCISIDTLCLPNSVNSVGESAFYGCTGIKAVSMPVSAILKDNAFLLSSNIEHILLTKGAGDMQDYKRPDSSVSGKITNDSAPWIASKDSLIDVEFSEGIETIGSYAFYNCTALQEVVFPASLKKIGKSAFQNCTNISRVEFQDGLESIDDNAFYNCIKIPEITLPDSVSNIGNSAFYNCKALETVILPKMLSKINGGVFNGCVSLSEIVMPDNITYIGQSAFNECTGLKKLSLPISTEIYSSEYTFGGCENIEEITLTKGTGYMPNYSENTYSEDGLTYYQCTPWYISRDKLKNVIIADGVETIGKYSFYNCRGFTSIHLPKTVKSIDDYAFFGCSYLREIDVPNNIQNIGVGAFENTALYNIQNNWENGQLYLGPYLLKSRNTNQIKDGTICIAGGAFRGVTFNETKKPFTIPESVVQICDYAFANSTLKEVFLPKTIRRINEYAFSNCIKLKHIYCNDELESIGDYAFSDCVNLECVVFNEKLEKIGAFAFNNCTKLQKIIITKSIKSIGIGAFYSSGLKKAIFETDECVIFDDSRTFSHPAFYASDGSTAYHYALKYNRPYYSHDACSHNNQQTETIIGSTCYSNGVELAYCVDCEKIISRNVIPLSNHVAGERVLSNVVEPMCTTGGSYDYNCYCVYCDKEVANGHEETTALGHSFIRIYREKATNTTLGYTSYSCRRCQQTFVLDYFAPTGKLTLKHSARTANAVKVQWNNVKTATGYQVQITTKDGTKWSTNATLKAGVTAYTFKNLAAGNNYKFRVRFYINAPDGKNYFSPWSATLNSPTLPKGTSFKLTTAKKAFTAKWTKVAGVTGYQVQYATNAKFSKAVTKTVKGASKYSLAVKSLKGGAKYYVRIRTYKTIGGKNYFSTWSAAKAVITKK